MKLLNLRNWVTGSFVFFLLFANVSVWGQKIELDYKDKALNACLVELRDRYNLQIAFNDDGLSNFMVSTKGHFASPEKAFKALLENLPVDFEKSGEVYLFYPKLLENVPSVKSVIHRLSAVVMDASNQERLPYSHVQINGIGLITDEQGSFTFSTSTDSVFRIQLSYLGYYRMDTLVVGSGRRQFSLRSSAFQLSEVLVKKSPIVLSLQMGAVPAGMRLNQVVARYLPGSGDNAVFNLLRLQPGILASGEQSSDMIIWGSYPSHSQVLFDGFTLFGLKNFNDNISAVNPYMTKDIRVLKGAYSAEFGERVGGIVDISGLDGNKLKPELNLNINNMTLSAMASIPVGRHNSFTAAFRQTYYNLYDSSTFQRVRKLPKNTPTSIATRPDYNFKDLNLKFAGESENQLHSYHLSFYGGSDKFDYDVTSITSKRVVESTQNETNGQWGLSAFWSKQKKSGYSSLNLSYSGLTKDRNDKGIVTLRKNNRTFHRKESNSSNLVTELKLQNKNRYRLTKMHDLHFGWGVIQNVTKLIKNEVGGNKSQNIDERSRLNVLDVYVEDKLLLTSFFNMGVGVRANFAPLVGNRVFLQPRVSAEFKVLRELKLQAAVGYHNQFISQSSKVDSLENIQYDWVVADGGEYPVLGSEHFMFGMNYSKYGFTANVEAYVKNTNGLTRHIRAVDDALLLTGDSKTKGIDFFLKQEYRGHTLWASYTLSQTLERFPFRKNNAYRRALQDQRHEVKIASIVKLHPFYLSCNYVYGSGFLRRFKGYETQEVPYSRFDAAITYRYTLGRVRLETGLSVLNVFDTENIKQTNFVRLPTIDANYIGIHAEAVPFTPTLFLNLTL